MNINMLHFILLFFLFFLGCEKEVAFPHHLVGVWETSAPKYKDRYLEITDQLLIFGIGNGQKISHYINKINIEEEKGETLYTFHYTDSEEEDWTLVLICRQDSSDVIRLINRDEIWRKVKP